MKLKHEKTRSMQATGGGLQPEGGSFMTNLPFGHCLQLVIHDALQLQSAEWPHSSKSVISFLPAVADIRRWKICMYLG